MLSFRYQARCMDCRNRRLFRGEVYLQQAVESDAETAWTFVRRLCDCHGLWECSVEIDGNRDERYIEVTSGPTGGLLRHDLPVTLHRRHGQTEAKT